MDNYQNSYRFRGGGWGEGSKNNMLEIQFYVSRMNNT